MPEISIRITNLPQIRAAFNRAPQIMGRYFNEAIRKSTFLVMGASKIRTPVKTGYLRGSHVTSFESGGINFRGIVEPRANYAMFVHEGTRFMRGRPFLRQGAEASENTIQGYFSQATQSAFNQIAGMV